jgi:hypothetical protein
MISELTGKTEKRWTKIIVIDATSLRRIMPVLEYWSKPLPKTMEAFMEVNGSFSGDIAGALGGLMGIMAPQGSSLARNQSFQNAKKELKAMGKPVPGIDPENPLYNNCAAEEKLYNEIKILLPPTALLDRHPMLKKYGKSQDRKAKEDLKKEIMKDWVPNATLFVCLLTLFSMALADWLCYRIIGPLNIQRLPRQRVSPFFIPPTPSLSRTTSWPGSSHSETPGPC